MSRYLEDRAYIRLRITLQLYFWPGKRHSESAGVGELCNRIVGIEAIRKVGCA